MIEKTKVAQVFTEIYKHNKWGGDESASGKGSGTLATEILRARLPKFLKNLGIHSMLDVPCGDFFWMNQMLKDPDMQGISYVGGDIVEEIIASNRSKYQQTFVQMDILQHLIRSADLIFCRDCLVYFSNQDIFRAILNFRLSRSKYLLTTNFFRPEQAPNIQTGNGWRPLNLCLEPFNFPVPLKVIPEGNKEKGFEDKAMALWKIADIY